LEAHDRWLAESGAILGKAESTLGWAVYHRAEGDSLRAYECAMRALAQASEPRQPLALLAAHRLLGELDTAAGRFDEAAARLDASLALADACAVPYERALALLARAALHDAQGRRTECLALLDEVRAICEPLGAKPALARADALKHDGGTDSVRDRGARSLIRRSILGASRWCRARPRARGRVLSRRWWSDRFAPP
jgi:tetratricopeptide (TPR) repeat protein